MPDNLFEPDETFVLTLSDISGATGNHASAALLAGPRHGHGHRPGR